MKVWKGWYLTRNNPRALLRELAEYVDRIYIADNKVHKLENEKKELIEWLETEDSRVCEDMYLQDAMNDPKLYIRLETIREVLKKLKGGK